MILNKYGVLVGDGTLMFDWCVILKPTMIQVGANCRVDSFVKLEGGAGIRIGDGVHIASYAHIGIGGGEVEIGDYAAVASGAKIISGSNQLAGLSLSASAPLEMQALQRYTTRLGRYATLLVNAVLLPGVTVGEGAVIGAGAVVTRDVPAWEVWAGVPARRIGVRDEMLRAAARA